jgi:hypothetical protein
MSWARPITLLSTPRWGLSVESAQNVNRRRKGCKVAKRLVNDSKQIFGEKLLMSKRGIPQKFPASTVSKYLDLNREMRSIMRGYYPESNSALQ